MQSKAALILGKVANRAFKLPSLAVILAQQVEVAFEVCLKPSRCSLSRMTILRTSNLKFCFKSVAAHLVDRMIFCLYPQRLCQPLLHFSIAAKAMIWLWQSLCHSCFRPEAELPLLPLAISCFSTSLLLHPLGNSITRFAPRDDVFPPLWQLR